MRARKIALANQDALIRLVRAMRDDPFLALRTRLALAEIAMSLPAEMRDEWERRHLIAEMERGFEDEQA